MARCVGLGHERKPGRILSRTQVSRSMRPLFSVIIPACNEASRIGACLDSVLASERDGADLEVVVVDNLSRDGTAQIAASRGVRVLVNPYKSPGCISRSRNMGAAATCGDIVVFLDADMVVPPDWLRIARRHFDGGFQGLLSFPVDVPGDAGWVGRIWGGRNRPQKPGILHTINIGSANMFVPRRLLDVVGGFDDRLAAGEDRDLACRVQKAGFASIRVSGPCLIHVGYEHGLAEFIRKEAWRQGCTLHLAARHGLCLRSLRNPLLSLYHLFCGVVLIVALVSMSVRVVPFLALAWVLPSVAICAMRRGGPGLDCLGLVFLTWLRWNVAGWGVMKQVMNPIPGHGKAGLPLARRRVIITADDYGLCASVNRAIEECLDVGTVTATCVMVNMPARDDAAELRRRFPRASLGLHWTLTQGAPVAPPDVVRTLLDEHGLFLSPTEFKRRWRRGLVDPRQVEIELEAQYRCFVGLAGQPDFWNSHQYINVWPPVFAVFIETALRLGLTVMRNNYAVIVPVSSAVWLCLAARPVYLLKRLAKGFYAARAVNRGMQMPRGLIHVPTGDQNVVEIERILTHPKLCGSDAPVELMVHPAVALEPALFGDMQDSRLIEYLILRDPDLLGRLNLAGIELCGLALGR